MADGGNYSSSREEALLTSEMAELLTLFKTQKDRRLLPTRELEHKTNCGRLCTLTRRRLRSPRVSTQISDFTATDHSTFNQDSQ
jgi:hypothetical protein